MIPYKDRLFVETIDHEQIIAGNLKIRLRGSFFHFHNRISVLSSTFSHNLDLIVIVFDFAHALIIALKL